VFSFLCLTWRPAVVDRVDMYEPIHVRKIVAALGSTQGRFEVPPRRRVNVGGSAAKQIEKIGG
jgi:hypothetical protein